MPQEQSTRQLRPRRPKAELELERVDSGSSYASSSSERQSRRSRRSKQKKSSSSTHAVASPSSLSPSSSNTRQNPNPEYTLTQELALTDFRAYLLSLEVQNRERLRRAQGEVCVCLDGPAFEPVDQHPHLRDYEMQLQAVQLQQRRRELQGELERVTGLGVGREEPEFYGVAREGPTRVCGGPDAPSLQHLRALQLGGDDV